MASRRISASKLMRSGCKDKRCARKATCWADSSPDTYTQARSAPIKAVACNNKVDLPMPGSPPNNTTAPSTKPPPNTRSNSVKPVVERGTSSAVTSAKFCTLLLVSLHASKRLLLAGNTALSCKVFHCPQWGHWPVHFGVLPPHSLHWYWVLTLAIDSFYRRYLLNTTTSPLRPRDSRLAQ